MDNAAAYLLHLRKFVPCDLLVTGQNARGHQCRASIIISGQGSSCMGVRVKSIRIAKGRHISRNLVAGGVLALLALGAGLGYEHGVTKSPTQIPVSQYDLAVTCEM